MNRPIAYTRPVAALFAAPLAALSLTAPAQLPYDPAAVKKWSSVKVVRYEVVGEFARKHVQIPPTDADLYADITERVSFSVDWDVKKGVMTGPPEIRNEPGKATNLVSLDRKCPTGKMNGPYEHFDIVEIRQSAPKQALELVGKRVHPETQVAEACGNALRPYKGATKTVSEYVALPDPVMLAYGGMAKPGAPVAVTPDGRSIRMKAQNSDWTWTLTPVAK